MISRKGDIIKSTAARRRGTIFWRFAIPIALHTAYDACTAFNTGILSISEDAAELTMTETASILIAAVAVLSMVIWQFVFLIRVKKETKTYCDMTLS